MKKIISLILVLSLLVSSFSSTAFAGARTAVRDKCMHLDDMLIDGFWTNHGVSPVCGCKTCVVLLSDYNHAINALEGLRLDDTAKINLNKYYSFLRGKEISGAIGSYTLSLAILDIPFLSKHVKKPIKTTKDTKKIICPILISPSSVFIFLGAASVVAGGAWYILDIKAEEARKIVRMTEGILNSLSVHLDAERWKYNKYLIVSYDTKDGSNFVAFNKNDKITYSENEMKTFENDFKNLNERTKNTLKEIKDLDATLKKEFDARMNNKIYKAFIVDGTKFTANAAFKLILSVLKKLYDKFSKGEIPTPEEFLTYLNNIPFDKEISKKDLKNLKNQYEKLLKAKVNPDEFIKESLKELEQINELYNFKTQATA